MRKKPEILSPAGNFEKMRFALNYGADAVYLSGKQFGMRSAPENFTESELYEAVKYCHERNKKIYVTVNIMPHPDEAELLPEYLEKLSDIKPDALIISDLGVFSMAKKYAPNLELHVSTQASNVNAQSCMVWHEMGAKRIVLARELSLKEIISIKEKIPETLEIEAFVHGSMCVSMSGRCLLSNYYTDRDANRGMCAQPCRWEYLDGCKYAQVFEKKRPEHILDVVENEMGTYIFASKDMCMIEHIPDLVEAGIDSFKIEGRVKSAYYTAVTANAYKNELNSYFENKENYVFNPESKKELESVSHREYCTGYFYDNPMAQANIVTDGGYIKDKAFLATVEEIKDGRAYLFQRNKMCEGEEIEIVSPGRQTVKFVARDMRDEMGEKIETAPHPKMIFSIIASDNIHVGDILRGK